MKEALKISYKNSHELDAIIDSQLPSTRPQFRCAKVRVHGEIYEMYHRNIMECVKALWEDPEFADLLDTAPVKLFIDAEKKIRIYHNMNTGKWWWATQVRRADS